MMMCTANAISDAHHPSQRRASTSSCTTTAGSSNMISDAHHPRRRASMSSTSSSSSSSIDEKDRQELMEMARRLRRIKRRLLLKTAEAPKSPADALRELLIRVSLDEDDSRSSLSYSSSSLSTIEE